MQITANAWTEDELMALPKDGCKRELIDGEIIMSPAGYRHERIVAAVLSAMLPHATKHRLGVVCGSGLGCWMNSGNLLSPDISFIAKSRLAVAAVEKEKYLRGAPDLVVEVLSPWDRSARLQEKLPDYFSSGAQLIWVLDPAEKRSSFTAPPRRSASCARPIPSKAKTCSPVSASRWPSCSPNFRSSNVNVS